MVFMTREEIYACLVVALILEFRLDEETVDWDSLITDFWGDSLLIVVAELFDLEDFQIPFSEDLTVRDLVDYIELELEEK